MSFAKSAFAALAITLSLGFASAASAAGEKPGWYGQNDEGKTVFVTDFPPKAAKEGDPGAVKLCPQGKVGLCGTFLVKPILLEKAHITPDVPFADPTTASSAQNVASSTNCNPEPSNRNLYDCPAGIKPTDSVRYQWVSGNTYRDSYASQNGNSPFHALPPGGYLSQPVVTAGYVQPAFGTICPYVNGCPMYYPVYGYVPCGYGVLCERLSVFELNLQFNSRTEYWQFGITNNGPNYQYGGGCYQRCRGTIVCHC